MSKYMAFLLGMILTESFQQCLAIVGCGPFDICNFLNWGSWGPCSEECGGGVLRRQRPMCCWPKERWSGPRCQLVFCGADESEYYDSIGCNELCNNSGIYMNGRCQCPSGYTGRCCQCTGGLYWLKLLCSVCFVSRHIPCMLSLYLLPLFLCGKCHAWFHF